MDHHNALDVDHWLDQIRNLTDQDLDRLSLDAARAWRYFEMCDRPKIAAVLHASTVILAEEHDRRRRITEALRRDLDGDDIGAQLEEGDAA